jgi:alkylation response protein AidB-like acyl-CoA dehydrogenase
MDFQLSEDQLALQSAANDLLGREASPERVRAVVDGGGGWDRSLWAALVEQGWPGIAVPEDRSGVGLGWVEAAVLLESVGAHVAPVPVLGQLVAAGALVEASSDGGAAGSEIGDALAGLVSGDRIAVGAFRPLHAAVDGDGGRWVISGTTEPVPFAPSADLLVVPAVTADGEERLVLVELDEHTRPPAVAAMDRTREVGRVVLEGAPAVELGGAEAVQQHVDRGASAHSAELLGIASRCLELAVAYAEDRVQFGRPIGSFQAVKHRCADMLVDVEGMRSASWWAAWCLSAGDPEADAAASVAKSWCSDAADRVVRSALQVHGGIGFTWECDVHLYLKRAQLDRTAFGDAAWHRDRLASLLRARVESGASVI